MGAEELKSAIENRIGTFDLTDFKETLKKLDLILGLYSISVLVLCAIQYFQGQASLHALIWFAIFTVGNLSLSQITLRVKNPFFVELARIFPLGIVSCFFVHYHGDNIYSWSLFLVMSLGCSTNAMLVTRRPKLAYAQVWIWLATFLLANWMKPEGLSPLESIIVCALMIMTTTLFTSAMSVLNASIDRERNIKMQMMFSSKMSALGEMAGGVAHEINNPLAIIKTLVGQLRDYADDEVIDKSMLKETLADVEGTVDRIAKIIKGLRSFSRDGSRDLTTTVSVAKLLQDTLGFCGERFKQHQVDLRYSGTSDGISFEGREVEISQVLLNLLNNSYDAILPLKEKWIELSVSDLSDAVEISVTDSGPGISPEVRKKLFQPFFTTKEIGKGTGLGLSVSTGLVEGHNGTLTLDTSGFNTRFVVRLPKRTKKPSVKVDVHQKMAM